MADLQEHPNATGLGWADGMGQGIDTQLYTNSHTRLASVGRMGRAWDNNTPHTTQAPILYWPRLGWMGRAWDNNTPHTTQLTNVPGPTVGWMGQAWDIEYNTQHSATTLLAPWLGGWDGPGSSTHNSTTQPGLIRVWPHGWVDGTGLEDHILRDNIPGPMVGWLGWAWDNSTQLDNTTQ
ncbi:hypothetical protein AnigIFM63309_007331 [Aspergillus niger]|nr:hypothetical protein AnigIFM63309_007331 [Aspergillus niger]